MSVMQIESIVWPLDQLDRALEQLARSRGWVDRRARPLPTPPAERFALNPAQAERWLNQVAAHLQIEVESIQCSYADIERLLGQGGPLLLRLPETDPQSALRLLAIRNRNRFWVEVIAPDRTVHRLARQEVRNALCATLEAAQLKVVEHLLTTAQIPIPRQAQVRRALLHEQLASATIKCGWLLRSPPAGGWIQQMRRLRLPLPLILLFGSLVAQQGLLLFAWRLIGGSALQGQFERGWFWGWALLMLSTLFFQFLSGTAQQQLARRSAAYFKQRLLYGMLKLDPQTIRHQGMGQFLHSMMGAEAVESFGLQGGFGLLLTLVQLASALLVLNLGIGGWRLPLLLLFWMTLVTVASWLYLRHALLWDTTYQSMTNEQVERMVGHRTRLAQEDPAHWHEGEDGSLDRYWHASVEMDRFTLLLQSFALRGWQVIALVALFAMLLCGTGGCGVLAQRLPALQPLLLLLTSGVSTSSQPIATALLLSLGGLMLAQQALSNWLGGIESFISLVAAWRQVRPLFAAAKQHQPAPAVALLPSHKDEEDHPKHPFLLAQQLDFRYRSAGRLAVQGASLQVFPQDRLLLEGTSGGGKSSLAALLAGLRQPTAGLLLLHGFDRETVGSGEWRRRVVAVPQFHENHIFSESLAFNLLLGRNWPPTADDLQAAESLCRELGLGELLGQMPAGLQQMLGESGWRLSHGERSRIFMARALLQAPDLIVLDESFAALDPATMRTTLETVLRRAPALLVIAHP